MTALPSIRTVAYGHGELAADILEALGRVPSASAGDLVGYLGCTDGSLRSALAKLRRAGAVVVIDRRDGRHVYALAGEDIGRAGRRADAAAAELGTILSLLTRAGVGATSLDGRLLSPAERVEMALMRGHA